MRPILLAAILLAGAWRQAAPPQINAVPVGNEPHHHLIFQNDYARAYYVEIPAHQATLLHQHDLPYMAVALGPTDIINAVQGKPEAHLTLTDGQVLYSNGGFAHIARADTGLPFRNITVEFLHPQGEARNRCTRVIADQPASDCPSYDPGQLKGPPPLASIKPLFETDEVRVLSGVLAGNGDWSDNKPDRPARLLLVLDQSTLSVENPGQPAKTMKTGEALWLSEGVTPTIRNLESLTTSAFVLIAFKDSIPEGAAEEKKPEAKSARPAAPSFFAMRFSHFEKQNIVPFGIMEHGPARPASRAGEFRAHDAFAADGAGGAREVRDLEKDDGLVARRIILRSLAFHTQEAVAGVELREVPGSLVGELEPECLAVEFFCRLEVVRVQLDSNHPQFRAIRFRHSHLSRVSYANSLTLMSPRRKAHTENSTSAGKNDCLDQSLPVAYTNCFAWVRDWNMLRGASTEDLAGRLPGAKLREKPEPRRRIVAETNLSTPCARPS